MATSEMLIQPKTDAMTEAQARAIVGTMYRHVLYREGVCEKPESLEGYTLQQLLAANQIVEAQSKEAARNKVDGKYTIQGVIADRLIAAIYTTYHYQADNTRAIAFADGKCVVVVNEPKDDDEEPDED